MKRTYRLIKRTCIVAALVVTAMVVTPASAQDKPAAAKDGGQAVPAGPLKVDLRPKMKSGQVARYQVWTLRKQNNSFQGNGQARTVESTMEVNGEVTWRVNSVQSDGSASCTMVTDWMAIKVTGPDGKEISSDSRDGAGDNEMMHKLLQAIAGTEVRVEVGPNGTIRSAAGHDAVKAKLGDRIPAPDDDDFVESASDLATLPGAIADMVAGATWDHELKLPHELGMIKAPMRYQLDSVEQVAGIRIANISGKAALTFEPKLPDIPAGGPQINVQMTEGTYSTQVMFDLARNEAVGRNTIQSQTIEVAASFQGNTMTRGLRETIHSQVLRISEE